MIPYFEISTFNLGRLTIHTWGFLVSIGFAVGMWAAYRRAKRVGLHGDVILDLAFWILFASVIGARFFHVFFYEWGYYQTHLPEIIRIDQGGLSSFGGFIGAAIAFALVAKRRHLNVWRYADCLMFAWPLGHSIGRLGCFLTHMHPGRLSNLPFAVAYPDGARLDMGLIESVLLLSYWVIMLFVARRPRFDGFYLISGMLFYGFMRFGLDFLRASDLPVSDARYFGLTPAQYGSAVLVILSICIFWRIKKKGYASS